MKDWGKTTNMDIQENSKESPGKRIRLIDIRVLILRLRGPRGRTAMFRILLIEGGE